jgi:hypothetical protein
MTFKLYTDKSSMSKKNSRYVQGGTTSVGANFIRWWERETYEKGDITDISFIITPTYEAKPDLIAFDYYGKHEFGWLVLQYNNIVDINEELAVGKVIELPSRSRVFYELLTKPSKGNR